ncbi:MAG TPA: GNAT family N-acetyltransferase [Jatrophihabitans sp.]|nr:GNAT family N-acetyltransferase [Jatrophihabitans sp.]
MPDDPGARREIEAATDLVIRRAAASDVAAIARLYGRISAPSFAARFMTERTTSTPLLELAAFEADRGDVVLVAVLASDPARAIAEARYMPTGDGVAEFSIVVDDAAQGQGVGRRMMAQLVREAEHRGLDRLSAYVLTDNARMRRLVDGLGWALVRPCEYGVLELEVSARGGMPGWPEDGRRRVLVESSSHFDSPTVARLRAGGAVVRRCLGPMPASAGPTGTQCPLVTAGACRLAEQADDIICSLRGDDYAAILAEHRRRWPDRLRVDGG